jgi:feruloyl-CoA synthase
VGPLRARVIADGAPCVQDAVVTGLDRDEVGLLVFPRFEDCRRLAGLPPGASNADIVAHAQVRAAFLDLLQRLVRQSTGTASRPTRLLLLTEPPSMDGEMTDKGSVNQRSVLGRRAADVLALYAADPPDGRVIRTNAASSPAASPSLTA